MATRTSSTNTQKPEPRRPVRVGYLALTDSAPLAVAEATGLFKKYDLPVELHREVGWATVRDKIIYRELDAAFTPGGIVLATALGLQTPMCPCITAFVVNLHGNGITLSKRLWDEGVHDARSLKSEIERQRGHRRFVFGTVFPSSSHTFLLRAWLRSGGIDPDHDVQIAVVPPAQMFRNLKASTLDGYCVGEPWNSVAVAEGVGWCHQVSAHLDPGHPEKVLMVREDFAEQRRDDHLALIAALSEACEFCDHPENRLVVADWMSAPRFLHQPVAIVRHGLAMDFDTGHDPLPEGTPFHIFSENDANDPTPEKARWVLRGLTESGLLSAKTEITLDWIKTHFRHDIYQEAMTFKKSVA